MEKFRGKAQSILELLEENGPVSEKTRNMILSETDMERLSVWLKAAADQVQKRIFWIEYSKCDILCILE